MENQQIKTKFEGIKLLSLLKYFLISIPFLILPIWLFAIFLSWLFGIFLFKDIKESSEIFAPLFLIPFDMIIIIWIYNKLTQHNISIKLLVKYQIASKWFLIGIVFLIIYIPFHYSADILVRKIIPQISIGEFLFSSSKIDSTMDHSILEYNWIIFIYDLFFIVIVGSIIEEIFWRGIILHKYASKFGIKKTIVISSIVFSIIHLQKYYFINIFAFSIAFSILYLVSRSLLIPIFCHAILNAKTAFFVFFGIGIDDFKYFESLYDNYGNPYLLSLVFIFSIGLLVFFFYIVATRANYKSGLPYFENEKSELTEPVVAS